MGQHFLEVDWCQLASPGSERCWFGRRCIAAAFVISTAVSYGSTLPGIFALYEYLWLSLFGFGCHILGVCGFGLVLCVEF